VISLLDNTVMSNFAAIGRPDLLRTAFGSGLATSQQAFDELEAGVRVSKLPSLDWSWLPVWTLEEEEVLHYHRLLSRLNAGEAACLAIALNRNCRLLTDDRDAREFALHFNSRWIPPSLLGGGKRAPCRQETSCRWQEAVIQ
jgi:predicted nucleic acid-binding protein